MNSEKEFKVAIVNRMIPHYRRDFFCRLKSALEEKNISLILLYGQPEYRDALKNDSIDMEWGIKVPSKIVKIGHNSLYWQPVLPYLRDIDLVIVEQASKLLINYVLLLRNRLGVQKLAFWGHGRNFQETSINQLGEWIKRQVSTKVHWWFAYNEMSAAVVREMGYPAERITVVQNAVDTRFFANAYQNLSLEEIKLVQEELNLKSRNVGIYAGGLYAEKRLPFLLKCIQLIHQRVPDFEMIFIGDGEDTPLIKQAAEQCSWIHYVGTKFDREKVPYYAVSKLFLMPGMVGLGILDTFAMETPLITTQSPLHSPEISYLENGVNGIMISDTDNPQLYADRVIQLINNPSEYNYLVENCRKSWGKYTIENMVKNFADGVELALEK